MNLTISTKTVFIIGLGKLHPTFLEILHLFKIIRYPKMHEKLVFMRVFTSYFIVKSFFR